MELVLSHVGTDFDALASMVFAQKLYPGSQLVFPGRKSTGVKEFYDLHKRHFPFLSLKKALAQRPKRLIVVDTRTPSRLGDFRQWLNDSEVELHIYDHHPPTAESVRGDQEWVERVGAAATLLIEQCRQKGLAISCEEASLGLIAIHEETGSFRYSATTARDLEAAAFLMKKGANLEVVSSFLKDPLSDEQRALLEEYLTNGHLIKGPGGTLYLATASRKRSVFGLGYLATKILDIEGADAVCTVLETGNEGTTIVARSSSDNFDVAKWMSHWGGGGHSRAAAVSRVPQPAAEVAAYLEGMVKASAGSTLLASDVMSADLFAIDLSYTVGQAHQELVERGFHAACVLGEDKKLEGLVCLTDLNKALDHKLAHAPARSVMTHKVVSVNVDDTIDQVRRVVVERNVGSLPVLKNGEVVGILTRTDLLRELYQEAETNHWAHSGEGQAISLAGAKEPFLTWLKVTTRLAAEKKIRLYAVGGFVRDLLLGRENDDLDLMVEGDAVVLARQVARELGGKFVKHEKYLTASIKFECGNKLDLATARREVYVRPAALPEVAESKLKSDLYRRDFTVNSLALRLNDRLEGTVVDFFGGRQDLEGRKIRVLHNHSFFDDPTRILRAVRFEQRLGFTIEPHTQQLMKAALEADVFSMTYSERLAEEIRLSLSEHDPIKVFKRLDKLKVLKAINPELSFNKKVQKRIQKALDFMGEFPDVVPSDVRWLVPLMLIGFELSEKGRRELVERFGWERVPWPDPADKTLEAVGGQKLSCSEIAAIFDRFPQTHLAVMAGLSGRSLFQKRLRHYLRVTKNMKPMLNGRQVLEAGISPGPEVAKWKNRALAAQRDGIFSDEAGALHWFKAELANS
jgi:tRNA nucleotidyltransferase (CCA-adding enzyme)